MFSMLIQYTNLNRPNMLISTKLFILIQNRVSLIFTRNIELYVPPVRNFQIPEAYDKSIQLPDERILKSVPKIPPPLFGMKIRKMMRQLRDIRGPELVHTFLVHKQFAIRALHGGQIHHGHFEMMRLGINRNIDQSRMFAVWRIDPPWKTITRKGQGHRMGGGKGSIDHYVTPIKAGRIILEVGGHCNFSEVEPILSRVAAKLPFKAVVISQKHLDEQQLAEERIKTENLNPYNFERCLKNNFLASRKWASPFDYLWHGKYK